MGGPQAGVDHLLRRDYQVFHNPKVEDRHKNMRENQKKNNSTRLL